MAEPIESGMTESVNAHVLIGFAESLPAPEVAWSLTDAGFRVTAFGRRGAKPLLRHCSEVRIVPVEAPERDVAAAQRDLEHAIAEDRPAVFLPLDDVSLWLCGRIGEGTETLMPAKDHVRLALDKERPLELQREEHGRDERAVRDVVVGAERRLDRLDGVQRSCL